MRELFEYLSYPFVRYALIVGVLIALCASVLGVILVLKHFSFLGDGLSHVAFGAMAVAAVMGLSNNLLIVIPVVFASAIILLYSSKSKKMEGDLAVGLLAVGSLAIGYLLMNIFPSSSNISADVCTSLFGSTSILTLSKFQVTFCIVLSIVVIVSLILFYNRIFAITFDEDFTRASGLNTKLYNLVLAIIIASVIVLAMNLVGSLLISALVIFPAASSLRLFKSFKSVTISSAIIGLLTSLFGIIVSIFIEAPVGPMIVTFDILVFLCFYVVGLIKNRRSIK